jgi:hypothetical protein
MSRTGKIARIPRKIRTELNERLDNGEEAKSILAWLNDMPQVDDVLRDHFKGALITEQNLSEWRQGGFREWAFRQQFIEHACETFDAAGEMDAAMDTPLLAGHLAALVATRYAALLNHWDGLPSPEFEQAARLLRGLTRDIALLQRTLQEAERYKRQHQKEVEDQKKDRLTAPIMAELESDAIYAALGGGGERNRAAADFMAAVKHDLRLPQSVRDLREKLERLKAEQARQQAQAAKQTKNAGQAQTGGSPAPVAVNPTKSNQAQENSEQDNAPEKAA